MGKCPYDPGAGTRPLALRGRDDILRRFDVTLSRMASGRSDVAPLITGSRGSGKTVLLNELVSRAKRRGWFTACDEVTPDSRLSNLIAVQAREILLEMSARQRMAEQVRRVLGVLRAFTSVSALGISLSIDADKVEGTADSGIFSRDLRHLFIEIGQLAREQSVGVIFALDEVHALEDEELYDLNSALHQTAQRQLPVAFLGAGLFPSWQKSGSERAKPTSSAYSKVNTYESRMYASTYVRLEPLDTGESTWVLAESAMAEQVRYTNEALSAAVEFCEGNVWVLQLLGAAAWELADSSPIGRETVASAIVQVKERLGHWFFPRLLQDCSRAESLLLMEMARLGTEAVSSEVFVDYADEQHLEKAIPTIESLARRDLVTLENFVSPYYKFDMRFSVPLLGDYLRGLT